MNLSHSGDHPIYSVTHLLRGLSRRLAVGTSVNLSALYTRHNMDAKSPHEEAKVRLLPTERQSHLPVIPDTPAGTYLCYILTQHPFILSVIPLGYVGVGLEITLLGWMVTK